MSLPMPPYPEPSPAAGPSAAPRTRWTVYLTGPIDSVTVYADDWNTDGDNGALFTTAGNVVAAFRSSFLVAIVAEHAERARG